MFTFSHFGVKSLVAQVSHRYFRPHPEQDLFLTPPLPLALRQMSCCRLGLGLQVVFIGEEIQKDG